MVEPFALVPACMSAFCSACTAVHVSSLVPEGIFSLSLIQPISPQCGRPLGFPLYPVLLISPCSLTMSAPICLRVQVLLRLTSMAMFMKYSSFEIRLFPCSDKCTTLAV